MVTLFQIAEPGEFGVEVKLHGADRTVALLADDHFRLVAGCLEALHAPGIFFIRLMFALAQLSRKVEDREDKRPQLADLRESGSIEQDADVVMFVFREEYYHDRLKPDEDSDAFPKWKETAERLFRRAEVIIGKQRHGPIGTVNLNFEGKFTKFSDPVREGASYDRDFS